MTKISVSESSNVRSYRGEVELIFKDKNGIVIGTHKQPNIIKIPAKEIISHRLPHSKVWDPAAESGAGAWTEHNLDLDEFSIKYIVFGAAYDDNGDPLDTTDKRFYTRDMVTGGYTPITLNTGAEYDGGLINPIPISEPTRPLKRVERIYFEPSYQPAGSPLLQDDVRSLNNTVVFETTLRIDEYNGFNLTSSDYFTITEVGLVGAAEVDSLGACELDPRDIFLTGSGDGGAFAATANGTATVNLSISESEVDAIKEGDQIKVVAADSTAADDSILDQMNPYYLVVTKAVGGRDITLDRVPTDSNGDAITGNIGLLRDGFRLFSHRILTTPFQKSNDLIVTVRWHITLN